MSINKKIKDMSFSEQQRYYNIFMEQDRSHSYMWTQHRIHHNTMKVIVRNVLRGFIKEKEKEFKRIFKK